MSVNAEQLKVKVQALVTWWKATRVARALRQYSLANGALLSGGITYRAIFSLFAGIALGFTIFVRVLGGDDELKNSVIESLNTAVPGLIATGDQQGILPVDRLVLSTSMNVTSIIAICVLLWSVITAMESVRSSVRAMFALPPGGSRAFSAKLRSFSAFIAVGIGVLLSSLAGIGANTLGRYLQRWIDLGALSTFGVTLGSFLVTVIFDGLVFMMVLWLLAGVRPGRRDMLIGAAVVAVGFAVIRYLGTSVVVGSAANNPLFATGAVLITILVWLYMCARILLTAAAVAANPPLSLLDQLEDEKFARHEVAKHRSNSAASAQSPNEAVGEVSQEEAARQGKRPLRKSIFIGMAAAFIGFVVGKRRN